MSVMFGALFHCGRFSTRVVGWERVVRALMAVTVWGWLGVGAGVSKAAEPRWDPAGVFDEAARMYERGQYDEAIEAYHRLLTNGVTTAAVYFNRGNAYLKLGRTGHAIASYRVARLMAPRDGEVTANLQFARSKVRDGLVRVEPFWSRWLRWLTPNEWAALSLVFLWLGGGLMAARAAFPKLKEATRGLARPVLVMAVLALVPLGVVAVQSRTVEGVIIKPDAVVRFGPLEDAQTSFTLPDGAEVDVMDTKGGWVAVRDLAGRRGWVAVKDLVLTHP